MTRHPKSRKRIIATPSYFPNTFHTDGELLTLTSAISDMAHLDAGLGTSEIHLRMGIDSPFEGYNPLNLSKFKFEPIQVIEREPVLDVEMEATEAVLAFNSAVPETDTETPSSENVEEEEKKVVIHTLKSSGLNAHDAKVVDYCNNLIINEACANITFPEVTALARELYNAGCRTETALYIAIKFAGTIKTTPNAELMAMGLEMPKKVLVSWELEDLEKIGWGVAALARKCVIVDAAEEEEDEKIDAEINEDAKFNAMADSTTPQELALLVRRQLPKMVGLLHATVGAKLKTIVKVLLAPLREGGVGCPPSFDVQVKFAIMLLFLKEGKLESKPAIAMVNQRVASGVLGGKKLKEKRLRERLRELTTYAGDEMTWRQLKSVVLRFNKALDKKT